MKRLITSLLMLILVSLTVCGEDLERARLEIDPSSEIVLGEDVLKFVTKPAYPRLSLMKDGNYILAWQETIPGRTDDNGLYISYAISPDLKKWTPMGCLFSNRTVVNVYGKQSERKYSCPEFLNLSDGSLLCVCCYWNLSSYNKVEGRADNGIALRRSCDNGRSWSEEIEIFHGQSWEPFLMEQADGRIQCYFSEARAWICSANSGTSMVESLDGGRTWSPELDTHPYRVMRKKYWNPIWDMPQYTDQMPVGVILNDEGKMAFAMEDCEAGNYSLGIVYSPDDGKWKKLQKDEAGPSERIDSLSVNATGPYMVKFPTGEVLVTFTRNKGMEWPLMYRIGNSSATAFGPERKAFDRGGWTSACVDSKNTVVLVAPYKGKKLHIARFKLVK